MIDENGNPLFNLGTAEEKLCTMHSNDKKKLMKPHIKFRNLYLTDKAYVLLLVATKHTVEPQSRTNEIDKLTFWRWLLTHFVKVFFWTASLWSVT